MAGWKRLVGEDELAPQKVKKPLSPEDESGRGILPQRDQCTNRAIRMMIGIGTPRKNSSNERMVTLLFNGPEW
jgi:hypothetical protein